MTLREKQSQFAYMIGKLIMEAYLRGWELTLDEFYRPPETAELYAKQGRGSAKSLHTMKLAADINLFIGAKLQTSFAAYEPLGIFWESLGGSWGGRFTGKVARDLRHFSLAHGGMK